MRVGLGPEHGSRRPGCASPETTATTLPPLMRRRLKEWNSTLLRMESGSDRTPPNTQYARRTPMSEIYLGCTSQRLACKFSGLTRLRRLRDTREGLIKAGIFSLTFSWCRPKSKLEKCQQLLPRCLYSAATSRLNFTHLLRSSSSSELSYRRHHSWSTRRRGTT